ncbi:MAG: HEPN domain-containing protein [Chloroflexia bacterium]
MANNLAAESIPWTTVCFHSQQAAEKYLKALLVFHRRVPPRIHALVALLTLCVELNAELAELQPECALLADYAVEVRYLSDLLDVTAEDGRRAVEAMERICSEVELRLTQDTEVGVE